MLFNLDFANNIILWCFFFFFWIVDLYFLIPAVITQIFDPIAQLEKFRKLTPRQSEDYTTWCLLDYDYTKNHDRLMAVDLIRQKELDADPEAIWQIEFVGQLKNPYSETVTNESMFVLTILDKIKGTRLTFSQGSVIVLQENANCQHARVTLTSTQLNKLNSAAKNKTGTTLRINTKTLKMKNCYMNYF